MIQVDEVKVSYKGNKNDLKIEICFLLSSLVDRGHFTREEILEMIDAVFNIDRPKLH